MLYVRYDILVHFTIFLFEWMECKKKREGGMKAKDGRWTNDGRWREGVDALECGFSGIQENWKESLANWST
jgi:hypothetical protein